MRTTLMIDDDVLVAAQALAKRRGISLGKAVSELARRGFERAPVTVPGGDRTVFAVPADAKPITNEDVARALDGLLGGESFPKQ